jgi:hypothetical protein
VPLSARDREQVRVRGLGTPQIAGPGGEDDPQGEGRHHDRLAAGHLRALVQLVGVRGRGGEVAVEQRRLGNPRKEEEESPLQAGIRAALPHTRQRGVCSDQVERPDLDQTGTHRGPPQRR